MKVNSLKYICIPALLASMASCMDFDHPADEFVGGETNTPAVVYKGDADKLDYKVAVTEEGFDEAVGELEVMLGQFKAAQYYLLGGKNNEMPGPHQWQYVYNLTIDNYAGYTTGDNDLNGRLETTYTYYRDFCDGPNGRFVSMKTYLGNLMNVSYADSIVELKAMALLVFDYAAQEVTDIYGSIPYVDHKNNKEANPFEFLPGRDIYATIVANLDDIVATFDNFENRPDWYKEKFHDRILRSYDALSTTHTLEPWRRLANSLKLRMAMHVVKVMPEEAKKWAEEAVASGVIESRDHELGLSPATNYFDTHPLKQIMSGWNDSRLNASFESLLFSLDHPYTKYLLGKNSQPLTNAVTGEVLAADSRVVGLRAGIRMISGQQFYANPRIGYSQFTSDNFDFMPIYTMKWAEVDFLRAEGALRGWNMGGDAETFYNRGIINADCGDRQMGDLIYDTLVDDYMAVTEAKSYKYEDPMDSSNDIESVTHIGVKWNNADDNETKLEKIITQKYIAVFPYSYEAWTELRRTGYPRIFPVLNADMGDGSLKDGELIRRIPLPGRDTSVGLEDINSTGIDALGGSDTQATRVFWDTPDANF